MAKGFKAVQAKIAAKENIPLKNAGAILASSSRKASPAAKAANPALNKVKMPNKPGVVSPAAKAAMPKMEGMAKKAVSKGKK